LNSSYQDLIKEKGFKYPFRPGMTASVDIITEIKKDVVSVPLSAVTTRKVEEEKEGEEGSETKDKMMDMEVEEVIFVIKEGKAIKTIVKTGISDFDNIEVLEGANLDEEIVVGPFLAVSKRLKNDDLVVEKEEEKKDKDYE
jgi:HlyD family secretion protein